ncbi:MAG: Fic family protein [Melioribacteraceae bacterium]
MKNKHISQNITVFHGRIAPESGMITGYGAIIDYLKLPLPLPKKLSIISAVNRSYETDDWKIFSPRHSPIDTLFGHLVFAIKYEGINLLFFKKFFEQINPNTIIEFVNNEPHSKYSRKIWFLYEWLMDKKLDLPDLKNGNYISLLDTKLQYVSSKVINEARYKIRNNIPGTKEFSPLIFRTSKIDKYINADLSKKIDLVFTAVHKNLLHRTTSYLLLKDSQASFNIEGENPAPNRTSRWGRAIGEAGIRELTKDELLRLQKLVIEDSRFIKMGFRQEGGFVGEHNRITGEPNPEHISAHWQDIEKLISGLIDTEHLLIKTDFPPVLSASIIAFGFVFIHPFIDGNGRIHRYLIHHILSSTKFSPQGVIFPISSAILEKIIEYRKTLENYSVPLLDFIKWEKTLDNNIKVLNETIDYYRYFDATPFAEFLFDCIDYTLENIIPNEVDYLQNFDQMKRWLDSHFDMPDKMVSLLIRFLEQNNGTLSKRSRHKEFAKLTEEDVSAIEKAYNKIFVKK